MQKSELAQNFPLRGLFEHNLNNCHVSLLILFLIFSQQNGSMKAVVSVAACCCLLITLYSSMAPSSQSLVPLVLPLGTEEPSTTSSVSLPTAHTVTAFSLAKRLAMEHETKRTCPHAKPLLEDPGSHEV